MAGARRDNFSYKQRAILHAAKKAAKARRRANTTTDSDTDSDSDSDTTTHHHTPARMPTLAVYLATTIPKTRATTTKLHARYAGAAATYHKLPLAARYETSQRAATLATLDKSFSLTADGTLDNAVSGVLGDLIFCVVEAEKALGLGRLADADKALLKAEKLERMAEDAVVGVEDAVGAAVGVKKKMERRGVLVRPDPFEGQRRAVEGEWKVALGRWERGVCDGEE